MTQVDFVSKYRRINIAVLALAAAGAVGAYMYSSESTRFLDIQEMTLFTQGDTFTSTNGTGSTPLHVFVSVDCSFCRKAEPHLQQLENVTIYYHLVPGHDASARHVARSVWCARDPVSAWRSVAKGEAVPESSCDDGALERNYALARKLALAGTPAFVFENGRVEVGASSGQQLVAMLGQARAPLPQSGALVN
jgi:thiol:disulfide interchange protein DsbC